MNTEASPTPPTSGARLRGLLDARRGLLVPGAGNALAARIIESLGFEAVYLSGAGLTNTHYALPDLGFMSLTDVVQHTAAIRDAVALPLIVDADTGFGNALNVRQTVRMLERAGADAIQLEDQQSPKRCGHFAGKAVIDSAEMVSKIKAAVDARHSRDCLIVARTDARAVHGLDAAIDRAAACAEAGADVCFVEAPRSIEELQRIVRELRSPQVVNIVLGGQTPALSASDFGAMGFGMVLYANAALQGAMRGMLDALSELKRAGQLAEDPALVATFTERQNLVRKPLFDALESRYAEPPESPEPAGPR